jgi:hypothetical protein
MEYVKENCLVGTIFAVWSVTLDLALTVNFRQIRWNIVPVGRCLWQTNRSDQAVWIPSLHVNRNVTKDFIVDNQVSISDGWEEL